MMRNTEVPVVSGADFTWYLAILRRRLWMVLLLFAITTSVILVWALTQKPVYSAGVRLQVIPMEAEQVTLYSAVHTTDTDVIDLIGYQFLQTVQSGAVTWRTIAQLGLNTDAEHLLQRFRTVRDGEFVSVVVEADTPQDAETVVTTQVDNALARVRADRSRPAVVAGEFISQTVAVAEQTLAAAQADLQRFKLNHSLASLEREILAYQDIVREMRRSQEGAIIEMAQTTARIAALESEVAAAETAARTAEPASDERAGATRRAADLRSAIATLRGDLAGQDARKNAYERSIARWETELTSLIGLVEEHDRLAAAVAQASDERDFLYRKAQEARLKQQQAESVGYLKIVEPARRPDQPVPTKTLQIALVGGVVSLLAGVVLAFAFEFGESLLAGGRRRETQG